MLHRHFIKVLGNWCGFATFVLFIYPVVIGLCMFVAFLNPSQFIQPNLWVIFSAIPSVYASWFMSGVTGKLWETADRY